MPRPLVACLGLLLAGCTIGGEVLFPPPPPPEDGGRDAGFDAGPPEIDAGFDGGVDAGRPVPPMCTDGMLNGDESDVDCGGSCSRCPDGLACTIDDDCASRSCVADLCASVTFMCGVEMCAVGAELCESTGTPRCEDLPADCFDCDCLELIPPCVCNEAGPGELSVDCPIG